MLLHRLCDWMAAVLRVFAWIAFAALIATVGLQVLARNILHEPMIWTGDIAQLLFTWLIFLGAGAGLRTGSHYTVDLLPMHKPLVKAFTGLTGLISGVLVALILLIHGWELAVIRSSAPIQSVGISRFWMYLPIPLCGAVMLLFLAEIARNMFFRRDA